MPSKVFWFCTQGGGFAYSLHPALTIKRPWFVIRKLCRRRRDHSYIGTLDELGVRAAIPWRRASAQVILPLSLSSYSSRALIDAGVAVGRIGVSRRKGSPAVLQLLDRPGWWGLVAVDDPPLIWTGETNGAASPQVEHRHISKGGNLTGLGCGEIPY